MVDVAVAGFAGVVVFTAARVVAGWMLRRLAGRIRGRVRGSTASVAAAPAAGSTGGRVGCRVEARPVAGLLAGDVTADQYRTAIAELAADGERRTPTRRRPPTR